MKKIISVLIIFALVFAFASCSAKTDNTPETTEATTKSTTSESNETLEKENKTLVIYFSQTGTTKGIAEQIAKITGGDLYEISAAKPYVESDLDYNNDNSRATKEQNDKSVRPEIADDTVILDDYSTIYLGYPIWWGQAPRIMDTFVESHSFDGKKVIPFCTSGSSDIADSDNYLAGLAKSGDWIEGKRFGANASESEIEDWINSNK